MTRRMRHTRTGTVADVDDAAAAKLADFGWSPDEEPKRSSSGDGRRRSRKRDEVEPEAAAEEE